MDTLFGLDSLTLARIQFAFTVSFHIIFPAFTIGLSAFIAMLIALWHKSGDRRFERLARFWTKIFAVSFGMGVVSGLVLSYQFGTNWSEFSRIAGNIIGPLMNYEVLSAFFMEATFLGVLLFGWNRVPRWMHLTAGCAVAVGTLMSAFWILSANSWMHTPAGFEMVDGVAVPTDWAAIVFNPSFPYRFTHMVIAAYLTTAFVVLAVAARYLVAGTHKDLAPIMARMALTTIVILAPLQLVVGDLHGLNTAEHQPTKVAAMEGHWDSTDPAPLLLFAMPDNEAETNHFELGIPKLASFIITHDLNGRFDGLLDVPADERPNVPLVFWSFRIMVGIGLVMILMALGGGWLWLRGRLFAAGGFPALYRRVAAHCWPLGFVAILAGWITTETGRQPWIIHEVLLVENAASPVPSGSVFVSLALFFLVYGVIFSAGIYYINRLINAGPDGATVDDPHKPTPRRPISAAEEAGRAAMGGHKPQSRQAPETH